MEQSVPVAELAVIAAAVGALTIWFNLKKHVDKTDRELRFDANLRDSK